MATALTELPQFQFANIVLSQKKSFTFDDIFTRVQQTGINTTEQTLKRTLDRFCNNGLIIKDGSFYLVIVNDI
jgi:Fe2+ or Zn2+ uptake regulation protein